MTEEKRILRPETPKCDLDFYMPDIKLKDLKLSTKESFLLIADQAVKSGTSGIEFAITTDGKGRIDFIRGEKKLTILKISSGVFDRYWDLINTSLNSQSGLKVKIKGKDIIYDIAGEFGSTDSGRSITLRISQPMTEKELLGLDEETEDE